MKKNYNEEIAKQILRIRLSQMVVNEKYKNKEFNVPIHLALGHEAIAVAVDSMMQETDKLILSHRNIHYNLARVGSLRPEIDEYLLKEEGLAQGQLGSMNLANEERGIVYTSSILGNNLPVAAGIALGKKAKSEKGITIVVIGDGAIEEGAFYESLVFFKYNQLPALIIIENNGWSLATMIKERRCDIDVKKFVGALDIKYVKLDSNDIYEYIERLKKARRYALSHKTPVCMEVCLKTLGYWYLKTEEYPDGKFINYHAGPAPTVNVQEGPFIEQSDRDPVFVLQNYFPKDLIEKFSKEIFGDLEKELQ